MRRRSLELERSQKTIWCGGVVCAVERRGKNFRRGANLIGIASSESDLDRGGNHSGADECLWSVIIAVDMNYTMRPAQLFDGAARQRAPLRVAKAIEIMKLADNLPKSGDRILIQCVEDVPLITFNIHFEEQIA
jgi:hypothetical protein